MAEHQSASHPACDLARNILLVALAGTGVALADGPSNVLPIPPHRGEALTAAQVAQNGAIVQYAWRLHFEHVQRALRHGFYQGWDLHPAQLPARFAAVFSFFLQSLPAAQARLRTFSGRATRLGQVFDDAATVQGLLSFFRRGLQCGALTSDEADVAGETTPLPRTDKLFAMAQLTPQTEHDMIEILTGIFEGRRLLHSRRQPCRYQWRAQLWMHQASEMQGNLVALLKIYVARTADPLPNPDYFAQIQANLQLYDPTGRRYLGTPEQRTAYKQLLQERLATIRPCRRAQDQFFDQCYFNPAMQHASDFGVATPLGRAICYDIAIQAGAGRSVFYRSALATGRRKKAVRNAPAVRPRTPMDPTRSASCVL